MLTYLCSPPGVDLGVSLLGSCLFKKLFTLFLLSEEGNASLWTLRNGDKSHRRTRTRSAGVIREGFLEKDELELACKSFLLLPQAERIKGIFRWAKSLTKAGMGMG